MKQFNIIILSMLLLTSATSILGMDYTQDLSLEIMEEIFTNLPQTELDKAKKVCKNWRTIITNMLDYRNRTEMEKLLSQGNQRSRNAQVSRAFEIMKHPGGARALSARNIALMQQTQTQLPTKHNYVTAQQAKSTKSTPCIFKPILEIEAEAPTSGTRSLTPTMSEGSDLRELSDIPAASPRPTPTTIEILENEDGARSLTPTNLSPRSFNRSPKPTSPIPPRLLCEESAAGRTSARLRRVRRARTNSSLSRMSSQNASQSDSDSE